MRIHNIEEDGIRISLKEGDLRAIVAFAEA
jgi:hypothetical protein